MCGTNSLSGCWAIQPFSKEKLMTYTHSHTFIGQVSRHICLFLCVCERDREPGEAYRGNVAIICILLKHHSEKKVKPLHLPLP